MKDTTTAKNKNPLMWLQEYFVVRSADSLHPVSGVVFCLVDRVGEKEALLESR